MARRTGAGVAAAALLVLTACSGGGDSEAASGDSGAQSAEAPAEDLAENGGAARDVEPESASAASDALTAGDEEGVARVAVEGGSFIRTGRITVENDDLDTARDAVDRLVQRYGGHVADERTENEEDGAVESSRLTLRVPSESFGTVMAAIDELGAVQGSSTQEADVTTEVIDVASRIRTQEVSLRRLRGFLDEARTVPAIIRLESEIARREADLASLRGQQDYLDDQTSMSTIDLTLRSPAEKAAPPAEDDPLENAGFLSGLSSGWNALLDVLLVIATVVGAALPFVLVLVLLGVPLSVAIARARARSAARAGQGPSTA